MPETPWQSVDEYLCSKLLPADPVLDAALDSSTAAGLPPIAVAPNQGKLLALLVRSLGATSVLEIGTLGGYSTTWMARALPEDGRLITLEAVPKHAEVARANLERAGVAGRVEIRVAPALDSLERLAAEHAGPFDFVFIDADKVSYDAYFEAVWPKLSEGGLIALDNTLQRGRVLDESDQSENVAAVRALNDKLATDPRVVCAFTTIRDGLTLLRRA